MKKDEFKANILSSEFCKFSKDERKCFLELLDKIEPFYSDFFENVYFALILKCKFFYLKEISLLLKEEIENELEKKAKEVGIKNFNSKLFLSENELLKRFFRKKVYEKLPKWFI